MIFILPDEKIGYTGPNTKTKSVFASLRKIFIDLNENARPVTRARKILLNDQDIVSVCTRTLIGQKLSSEREDNKLPLGLVDWVSEKNKFESGQFITTILILHDIVSETIKIKKLNEPESENDDKIKNWFNDQFAPSTEDLEDLMEQVRKCFNAEVPLTFQPRQIQKLGDLFELRWTPWLYKLFTELTPYKTLIDFTDKFKLTSPELVNLYIDTFVQEGDRAKQRATEIKDSIKQKYPDWNVKKDFDEPIKHIDKEIKDKNWFFKVVFQRGLFASFLTLQKQMHALGIDDSKHDRSMEKYSDLWVSAINHLVKSELNLIECKVSGVSELFWMGISVGADKNIEYTKVGSQRISSWLNVWVCMYYLKTNGHELLTYNQVLTSDDQVFTIIQGTIKHKQVLAGFQKVVAAKLENVSKKDLTEKTEQSISKRYQAIRKILNEN